MSEIPLPSIFHTLLSMYGYFLPIMLYAAWSTLAFWDLGRREDLSKGGSVGWVLVILLVPFLGAFAYHVFGGSQIPRSLRAVVVGGGLGLFLIVIAVGNLIGGLS